MILVDVNLLVYAWDRRSPFHESAVRWLDTKLSESARVGLPWESLLGFMRVVTNPRIFERPAPVHAAWGQVERWLSARNAWVPLPGDRHQEILGKFLIRLGGGAKLIPDAHLAALAVEHGLALCSTDGDFARFEGLRWENPLNQSMTTVVKEAIERTISDNSERETAASRLVRRLQNAPDRGIGGKISWTRDDLHDR